MADEKEQGSGGYLKGIWTDTKATRKELNENLSKINETLKSQMSGVVKAVNEPPSDVEGDKEKKTENKKFFDSLKKMLKSAGGGMVGAGGGLLEGVKKMMKKYKKIIMGLLGVGLVALFSQLNMKQLKEMWISFKGALVSIYETIAPIALGIWNWGKETLLPTLVDLVIDSFNSVGELFTSIKERFDGWGKKTWKERIFSILGVFGDIGKYVFDMVGNILVAAERLLGGDGTFIKDLWGNIELYFNKMIDWFKLLFEDPKAALTVLWDGIWGAIKSIADWIWDHTIGPAVDWIKGIFGWEENKTNQPAEGEFDIWKLFKDTMKKIYDFFGKIFSLDFVSLGVDLAKKSGQAGMWLLGEMGLLPKNERIKQEEDVGGNITQMSQEEQNVLQKKKLKKLEEKEIGGKGASLAVKKGDTVGIEAEMQALTDKMDAAAQKKDWKAYGEAEKKFIKLRAKRNKIAGSTIEAQSVAPATPEEDGISIVKGKRVSGLPIVKPLSPIKTGIDWGFISSKEGGSKLKGYVPDPDGSKSGVTIATGFDLGARTMNDLKGLSPELQAKLAPFLGLKGEKAVAALKSRGLKITAKEAKEIDKMSKGASTAKLKSEWNANAKKMGGKMFEDLTSAQKTVVASVGFQYGSLSKTPTFQKLAQSGNWSSAAHELDNFGDDYSIRRESEAAYLRNNSGQLLSQAQTQSQAQSKKTGDVTVITSKGGDNHSMSLQLPKNPRNSHVAESKSGSWWNPFD